MAFWRSPSEFMVSGILSFLNVFDLLLPLRKSGGCGLDSVILRSCLLKSLPQCGAVVAQDCGTMFFLSFPPPSTNLTLIDV